LTTEDQGDGPGGGTYGAGLRERRGGGGTDRLADLEEFATGTLRLSSRSRPAAGPGGQRDKAFGNLSLALAERSAGLVNLKVDRAWDRVRDDARFAAVVRRVAIP
jgi:hypothetical protein